MMSLTFDLFTKMSGSGPLGPLVGIVMEGKKKLCLITEEIRYTFTINEDSTSRRWCSFF